MGIRRRRPFLLLLAGAVALSGIAGCAPSAPGQTGAPTAAPTPTATPTPDPETATIVVGGADLALLDADGGELLRIPYSTDAADAIAAIANAVGEEPQTAVEGQQTCFGEYDTARWGTAIAVKHGEALPLPEDAAFEVNATAATVGAVRVETPQGFAVGDPIAELIASAPEAPAVQFETGGAVVNYAVAAGSEDAGAEPYWGAQATDLTATGLIGELRAPLDFRFDC